MTEEVNEFYFDDFYTLKGELRHKEIKNYNVNHGHFNGVTQANKEPVIWLKMVFPESLIPQIIDNITFRTNCFPVINKKLHTINTNLKNALSYLILDTEKNIYLDILNVVDESYNYYKIKDFHDSALEDGTAAIQARGISKFDERSASELIQKVLDLLKDEGSSFSYIGKDFASKSLTDISQLLFSVHKQAFESDAESNKDPYLLIKPINHSNGNQSFDVNYWSTLGVQGNNINKGTQLETEDKLFNSNRSIELITTTVGGYTSRNNQDRIFFYRNALLTRGRIVTLADIKAFSFSHFRSNISSVRIQKGTRNEISVKEGFSRTIDIYLKINKSEKEKLSLSEWNYLRESFMKNLKQKSSNVFSYRLFEED
ncbi:MAG: hypothetical protein ABI892_17745 [Flavobacterium sp.]